MTSVKDKDDQDMTMEVQCVFKTHLPQDYHIPSVQININTSSTPKELTQIVKQLIESEGKLSSKDLKKRKFNFMIKEKFITSKVQETMDKLRLTGEETLEIFYLLSLEKPKPTHSIPQDEWISTIKSLRHIMNEKQKTYICTFFNGDLKVFNKGDHKELVSVQNLHEDSIICDSLFLKNDSLQKKIVVTCSQVPHSSLKVSEVVKEGKNKYSFQVLGEAKDEIIDVNDGPKHLSYNPLNNEFFCSATQSSTLPEQVISIWKLNQETLEENKEVKKGLKRQKVMKAQLSPVSQIFSQSGITSIKWSNPNQIIACSQDHAIKLFNVEQKKVEQVLFTNHKIGTCLDTIQENIILTGHEDSIVRLWDIRSDQNEKQFKSQYEGHSQWVSQVRVNSRIENIFISGGYDGSIKMWDIRNESKAINSLKGMSQEDYKVFSVEWNGISQILSGGSDSHLQVHDMSHLK